MREHGGNADMERWLSEIRAHFVEAAPDILPLFETYAEEAAFGRSYIDEDLRGLRPGARILEIGAGALLLSCQLMREGFEVVALEPVGDGFSHFDRMRKMVMERATACRCCPATLDLPAERLDTVEHFDYAFSINVMEHVDDVAGVLRSVGVSLLPGASYRFTCPNYLFPYEPHFNIPTLFSKPLTERMLKKTIFSSRRVSDAAGVWKSLNWIDVCKVERFVRQIPGLKATFNHAMLVATLQRVTTDPDFASRRSPTMRGLILALVRLRLHHLFGLIPAAAQPIMDCRIEKTAGLEALPWPR